MISYKYTLLLRKDFTKADGTQAIVLRAMIGGHRIRMQLDLFVRPEEFDSVKQLVRIPKDLVRQNRINAVLTKYKSRCEEMFFEARMSGLPLTPEQFKEDLDTRPALASFVEFIERELEKEKVDKAQGTVKAYRTVLIWLKKFRPLTTFADVGFEFVQDFDRFLRKNNIDDNSRAKYHRTIRKFVLLAILKRRRVKNPYGPNGFKIKEVAVERTWLSLDEVEKLVGLYEARALAPMLHRTLRHFLFQVVTSLRVSDLKKMKRADIEGDMIIFHPQKTLRLRKIVKVPLSELAKKLVSDSESKGDLLFKVPAEAQMNRYLKEIAAAARIEKSVTTHVGRHTFGFLYLLMGGKLEELREIMGHSKIETTMIYTHVDHSQKVAGVKRFDQIFKV